MATLEERVATLEKKAEAVRLALRMLARQQRLLHIQLVRARDTLANLERQIKRLREV